MQIARAFRFGRPVEVALAGALCPLPSFVCYSVLSDWLKLTSKIMCQSFGLFGVQRKTV